MAKQSGSSSFGNRFLIIVLWVVSLLAAGIGGYLYCFFNDRSPASPKVTQLQQKIASLEVRLRANQAPEPSQPADSKGTTMNIAATEEAQHNEKVMKSIIYFRAKTTITAIKKRDWETLAKVTHPQKGVRFSAYSFVRPERDRLFTAEQVRNFGNNRQKYLWGSYDGTGKSIELTVAVYFDQFVYSHDFINAKEISYNRIVGRGNTMNNIFEVYPVAIVVEYYFPGFEAKYDGMDWQSLRLIFEMKDGIGYLVGISHDQWTI